MNHLSDNLYNQSSSHGDSSSHGASLDRLNHRFDGTQIDQQEITRQFVNSINESLKIEY